MRKLSIILVAIASTSATAALAQSAAAPSPAAAQPPAVAAPYLGPPLSISPQLHAFYDTPLGLSARAKAAKVGFDAQKQYEDSLAEYNRSHFKENLEADQLNTAALARKNAGKGDETPAGTPAGTTEPQKKKAERPAAWPVSIGSITSNGAGLSAMVRWPDGNTEPVSSGEVLTERGIKVVSISKYQAVFESGGDRRTLAVSPSMPATTALVEQP